MTEIEETRQMVEETPAATVETPEPEPEPDPTPDPDVPPERSTGGEAEG